MKIAMIGQKGMVLGERGGGIERHVAKISTYLVESGHEVTIYARAKYAPEKPKTVIAVVKKAGAVKRMYLRRELFPPKVDLS